MERKNFTTLEDLLEDASFRRWALGEPGDHLPFWEHWLTGEPGRKELAEQAATIIRGLPFSISERPLDARMIRSEWEKVQMSLRHASSGPPQDRDRPRLRVRSWGLRIAASIALLLAVGFALQQYVLNPVVEHRTPFGKQLSIVLPDSTRVELNANSMLSYRRQNPRKVWLDGEAFFQVQKKPASGANFLVLTNDLTVEVLGTAFNVIEKEDQTEVILEEGNVRLNLNRDFAKELQMQPGDQVTFSAKSVNNLVKQQVKPEVLTSWKDGVQEFEDVLLAEVMVRIEAIYGWKTIYFDEELKDRKITIGLPTEDLDNALQILQTTFGMTIDKVENGEKVLQLRQAK